MTACISVLLCDALEALACLADLLQTESHTASSVRLGYPRSTHLPRGAAHEPESRHCPGTSLALRRAATTISVSRPSGVHPPQPDGGSPPSLARGCQHLTALCNNFLCRAADRSAEPHAARPAYPACGHALRCTSPASGMPFCVLHHIIHAVNEFSKVAILLSLSNPAHNVLHNPREQNRRHRRRVPQYPSRSRKRGTYIPHLSSKNTVSSSGLSLRLASPFGIRIQNPKPHADPYDGACVFSAWR